MNSYQCKVKIGSGSISDVYAGRSGYPPVRKLNSARSMTLTRVIVSFCILAVLAVILGCGSGSTSGNPTSLSLTGNWLVTQLSRVGLPTATCPGSISLPSGLQQTCSASDVFTFAADGTYSYKRAGQIQPLEQGTWQVVGTTLTTTNTLSNPAIVTTYNANLSGNTLLLNTQAISTTNQDLVGLVFTLQKQ